MRPLPLQPGASGGTYIPPEDTFEVKTAAPAVRFLTQAVQPPSNVYVEADDILQCNCASSQTGETVTVSYRLLKASGDLVNGQFSVSPPNTRAVSQHSEQLAEGFLLSMSCRAAVATTRGQTFVRLFLTGPELGQSQPSYMLMADYVTTAMAPGHPNGRVLAPSEGPGWIHIVTVSPPAAGLDWLQFLPTNAIWRIETASGNFATSAIVATRFLRLDVKNPALTIVSSLDPSGIGANDNTRMTWAPGVPSVSGLTFKARLAPLPMPTLLSANDSQRLVSNTLNIDAADQWAVIGLTVEEWLDNV